MVHDCRSQQVVHETVVHARTWPRNLRDTHDEHVHLARDEAPQRDVQVLVDRTEHARVCRDGDICNGQLSEAWAPSTMQLTSVLIIAHVHQDGEPLACTRNHLVLGLAPSHALGAPDEVVVRRRVGERE